MYAVQERLLPLTEPSLHRKVSPWHPAMPPFFPLQGVLAAWAPIPPADEMKMSATADPIARRAIDIHNPTELLNSNMPKRLLTADFANVGVPERHHRVLGNRSLRFKRIRNVFRLLLRIQILQGDGEPSVRGKLNGQRNR
jgi:hypothetical protein